MRSATKDSTKAKTDSADDKSRFVIQGGKSLKGRISVNGSKNAALPLLAASLLTDKTVSLSNIPNIRDVRHMMDIIEAMGAGVGRDRNAITITASTVDAAHLPDNVVSLLRGSILLLGSLLGRTRKATLPLPGGDIIGH